MRNVARPRVSRETRMLLSIALISVGVLWILARFRFPDRPAEPNPVAPVLSQLGRQSALEDVAATISDLTPRVAAWLVVVEASAPPLEGPGRVRPALRLRDDLAITWLGDLTRVLGDAAHLAVPVEARDPASGLAVVRVAAADVPELSNWIPRRVENPRYVLAADVSSQGMSLRPVFLGALYPVASPVWEPAVLWTVPGTIGLEAGTFLFSTGGALVGLVIEREERLTIVPGETLIATANRLLLEGNKLVGWLGVEVLALSPALAAATGASRGVVVTWVAPEGPADGKLRVGDVVETVDDYALETPEHWLARSVRLLPGDMVRLRVRRDHMVREFSVTAGPSTPSTALELGVDMRELRGTGTEVVHVRAGSAAARAGMVAGDIVTSIGGIDAPAPTVVSRTFAKSSQERPLLVAVIRNGARRILVLRKE